MIGQHWQCETGSAGSRQGDIRSAFVWQGLEAHFWAVNGHLGGVLPNKRFEFLATGLCAQGGTTGLSELDIVEVHLLWDCDGSMLQKQVIANFGIGLAEFVRVLSLLCCRPLTTCEPPRQVGMAVIAVTSQHVKSLVVAEQFCALFALGQKHTSMKAYFHNT